MAASRLCDRSWIFAESWSRPSPGDSGSGGVAAARPLLSSVTNQRSNSPVAPMKLPSDGSWLPEVSGISHSVLSVGHRIAPATALST